MGSFRDQFELNFGKLDPYDPIDVGPFGTPKPRRAALPLNVDEAMAGPTPLYTADLGFKPPPEDSGVLENVGRQIGAGTVQVGEMGLDAAGWLARKTPITDGIVSDAIYSMRDGLTNVREDILAGIDEEGRRKAAAEFLTLDPNRTIWQGNPLDFAEAVLYKAANALPATVATLAPPIALARAGMTAKAILSMGATEGVLSLGGIAGGIRDEINALDTETLMSESPRFVQLLEESGGDADFAREQLITETQGYAPLIGGAAVAAISSVAGRYFTPIFEKGGGATLGSRAGRGFAAEFPQEASQGATEQLVQNYAAQVYDLDRQLSEGVAEASVQEGVIGGTMGAGAGALFGQRPQRPQRPTPPRTAIDLNARPKITDQLPLPGIEPGGIDPASLDREGNALFPEGPRLDREGNEIMPDAADLPTPEPTSDIQAQLDDLMDKNSPRRAVFLAPGQDQIGLGIPKDAPSYSFNDGSMLIARDPDVISEALARLDAGESRQTVIGALVGAGEGKPTSPDSLVVQLLDEAGNVARESMVPNQKAAEKLGQQWSKENPNKRIMITTPLAAVGRRQALGQNQTGFGVQEDLFDNPQRGTAFELVKEKPWQREAEQGELGLRDTRPRRERVQQPPQTGVPNVPEELPIPDQVERPLNQRDDPEEVARRQFGMDFREPVTETTTTRRKRDVPTPDVAVQVVSDEGEVLEEHRFGTPAFAEEAADELAAQYPEFTIRVVPATRTETEVKTRAKVTPRGPVEPEYQGDVLEEVRDDIRDAVPFEERAEPIAEVEGARSVGQAGDKLVSRAADEFDKEEKSRIGGFYNPDRLTFEPKKAPPKKDGTPDKKAQKAFDEEAARHEKEYRDAWSEALDAELTLQMSEDNYAKGQAKLKKRRALKRMGEARQLAKPKMNKGKSETFYKAARAVDPTKSFEQPERESPTGGPPKEYGTATAQRNTEPDYIGEFALTSRKDVDNLPNYQVRHNTPKGDVVVEEFDSNDAATKRVEELKEKYPKRKVVKRMLPSRELDVAFEQAVIFREGREADIRYELGQEESGEKLEQVDETPEELTGELSLTEKKAAKEESDISEKEISYEASVSRERFKTPGQKLAFIRREAETLRRREIGQRSIKATPVRRSARTDEIKRKPGEDDVAYAKRVKQSLKARHFDTAPLTQTNLKQDESVSDRVKRVARAKQARKDLTAAKNKAKKFLAGLDKTQGLAMFDTMSDQFKTDYLYAREYLRQLIQFADAIQAAKNDSNPAIKLTEGVAKMLDKADSYKDLEKFTREWGEIAQKNEFDDLANLKFTSLASMRDPKKRAKATTASRNKRKRIREMREINETLRNDDLYQRMIAPVIRKMSNYFEDASNERVVAPYIPNEVELAEIRYALMTYRLGLSPTREAEPTSIDKETGVVETLVFPFDDIEYNPTLNRLDLFNALQQRMVDVGFEFDGWGNVVGFQATDSYLNPYMKARGWEDAGSGAARQAMEKFTQNVKNLETNLTKEGTTLEDLKPGESLPKEQLIPPAVRSMRTGLTGDDKADVAAAVARLDKNKERISKNKAKEEALADQPGLLTIDAVNGLIDRFQRSTKAAKTTITAIKKREAQFIRGLKQLGVWRQISPELGRIDIPGYKSKTYRLVGPRLDSKKILRPNARETIQRIAKLPIPQKMLPAVRAARRDAEAAAGLERFLDQNALDLFIDAAKPVQYDTEYTSVAESVGNQLIDGTVNGTDVVNTILQLAPQNSFYRNLADRLRRYDMSGVKVVYGTEEDFPAGQPGKFKRSTNTIYINRDGLKMGQLNNDSVAGARVVHTLTHELIHSATHMNVDGNPTLRRQMEQLRDRAREVWRKRIGTPLPYGLKVLVKSENEIHEFIAEAFSNHEFQNFLKDTPREPNTVGDLWRAFANAVRRILGLDEVAPKNNLFDAILMSEDILFDDAGFGGSVEGDLYITGEAYIDNVSTFVQDKAAKSFEWLGKVKNAGRNLMTFDQLYDTYSKYFTDGSFTRYMDAFKRRNSAISARMKEPEKLSTRWTKLETENPDAALELSRLGTAATIWRMTPSKQLTAKERSEVAEDRLKQYDALRARYLTMPKDARDLYDDIRQYYKDANAEEANLLLEAGLRGILTKGETKMMTTEEFRQTFPREVIEKFSQREDIVEALKEFIPEENLKGVVTQVQRLAHLRTISVGDYFPLMRYGDYTVYKKVSRPDEVFSDYGEAMARRKEILEKDPTLEVGVYTEGERHILRVDDIEFWMFESKTEAQKKADEIGETVEARHSRKKNNMAIASNAELITVLTALKGNPAAQAAIKEHYLRSLADQSFRKSELRRKNTKGVNYDIQHRNLANYLKSSAYYRAQLEHGWRMGEALQEMQEFTRGRPDGGGITTEQLGRVVQNVEARDAMTNDAGELNKLVRSGVNLTQFMMLTSPSYWMINATQPWLVTAPIMGGKHGMGNSYSALKHAFGLVKSPLTKEAWESKFGLSAFTDPVKTENAFNVVDQLIEHLKGTTDPRKDEYIELINDLRDINIIDINVLTELRQIADGVEGKLGTKILDASRILAHITEVNNRVVTAIAAYNLEMNKSGDKEAAKKYAADMISQTQFNYSSENKPPLFQPGGPLKWAAPLMFQFMQWPQHMYALLIRNVYGAVKGESKEARRVALKSLTGLLATHAAVGGVTGMALQPIKWAFGMLMFAFGDDDEPYTFANAINGRTFDNLIQEVATEALGPTLGRAVGSGLPTLLGTDLSARMSMGTLYFVDLRGDTAESVLGSLVASFGGATLNQAISWGSALGKMADGEIYRGAEQAMPKILRDVMRAGRYYNEGLVNNAGDTVIPTEDLSFAEVFLQGIGFSPDEVSRYYQGQAAIKGAQGYARDRRESLVREFVEEGKRSDILREVQEFNRAYPSLRISRSTLIRAARSQIERESRYGRYGANIDEREARDFAEYGGPFRR